MKALTVGPGVPNHRKIHIAACVSLRDKYAFRAAELQQKQGFDAARVTAEVANYWHRRAIEGGYKGQESFWQQVVSS